MLNSSLGLLVLPREDKLNSLPKTDLPNNIKHTVKSCLDNNNTSYLYSFNEYIIGLRNAIIHWGQNNSLLFKVKTNAKGESEIIGTELNGEFDFKKKKITFYYSLESGNDLEIVIKEVLKFCQY